MSNRLPDWLRPFTLFWRIIMIAALLLGAQSAVQDDPALLSNWRGVLLLLLMLAFVGTYELFEHTPTRRKGSWPVPYRTVLVYLIVQLTIMIGLLHYSDAFFGPLFSLLGHVFSSLPMHKWWLPLVAIVALLAHPLGIYQAAQQGSWGSVISFMFSISSMAVLAAFIGVLFSEHYKRDMLIAELRRTKDDLERYALQAEELAALRERTRLAREVHDSLGHALVLVNIKLEAAQRLYGVERARGDAELEATRGLVREAMADLRRSLTNLRAPLPDHQDLPAALERLAAELRARTALDVRYHQPSNLPPIEPPAAEALWRVAREALVNVERHAAAGSVDLALEQANGTLVLRVADDGSGVAPGALNRTGHYGIVGMRERVEALGGGLRVAARPGSGGTIVEARVPALIQAKEPR